MGIFSKLFNTGYEDFPPKPKWKPNLPVNTKLVLEKARQYTGGKRQLAVFKHGTVVYFPNRVIDVEESARAVLDKIYHSHPNFKPAATNDGNYLIEYSQPAFTIVFKDEIEKHWDYIEKNHKDGVCRAEVLMNARGEHNIFDKIGKICLFGRAKMFMDGQSPRVVEMYEGK